MTISVRQIQPGFAGEVSGVDITRPLAAETVAAIEAGMDRHAVLVFHDQPLTDDQQRELEKGRSERRRWAITTAVSVAVALVAVMGLLFTIAHSAK